MNKNYNFIHKNLLMGINLTRNCEENFKYNE